MYMPLPEDTDKIGFKNTFFFFFFASQSSEENSAQNLSQAEISLRR